MLHTVAQSAADWQTPGFCEFNPCFKCCRH